MRRRMSQECRKDIRSSQWNIDLPAPAIARSDSGLAWTTAYSIALGVVRVCALCRRSKRIEGLLDFVERGLERQGATLTGIGAGHLCQPRSAHQRIGMPMLHHSFDENQTDHATLTNTAL